MKSTFNFMKPFYMLATLISFSLGPWRHIVAMLLLLCVSRAAYTDQQVGIVGITSRIFGVRLICFAVIRRSAYFSTYAQMNDR